jgi:hypothetical protein
LAVQDITPIWVVTRAGVAADTVLCQLRTAPLVKFMTWMTPVSKAAEAGSAQPCSAYATSVPSGDAAVRRCALRSPVPPCVR